MKSEQFPSLSRNSPHFKKPEIPSANFECPTTCPCPERNRSLAFQCLGDPLYFYPLPRRMHALKLPLLKSHVQFPVLTSFQKISPYPRLCEPFRNAVSCYSVELLAQGSTSKLEDTPYRISATLYSVYYHQYITTLHTWTPLPPSLPENKQHIVDKDAIGSDAGTLLLLLLS